MADQKMSGTLLRAASALIALPFVIGLIWLGGWPFAALVLVAIAISMFEFASISMPGDTTARVVLVLASIGWGLLALTGGLASTTAMAAVTLLPIGIAIFFLFHVGELSTVAARTGLGVLGMLWAGALFCVGCLRLLPDGFAWVILACLLAWGSDTGAYFAGRWFGKHKLYESVSPKKTWEGAIGGVLVATAGAFVMIYVWGAPQIEPLHLAFLAPIASALGQVGDLAESLLKRSVGVKDSGTIMPGHGGLFDRVDALIFVGAALFAYVVLVKDEPLTWLTV